MRRIVGPYSVDRRIQFQQIGMLILEFMACTPYSGEILENRENMFLVFLSLWTFFFLFHIHNFQKNFRFHIPIAYHGRASSVVISGTDIVRPRWDNFPGSILHLQLQHVMRSWMISTSSETLWFRSKCIWLQNYWHPKNNSGGMANPVEALLNCLSLHFWKL